MRWAYTETEIASCYPVMKELRPMLSQDEFVSIVKEQQKEGYQLVFKVADNQTVAVAGFRIKAAVPFAVSMRL